MLSRLELQERYGYDEGRECAAVASCANCGATSRDSYLNEYPREDGTYPLLCDDCADEERRAEERADLEAIGAARRCCQCKTKQARATSIYCSDHCKQSFYAELRGA